MIRVLTRPPGEANACSSMRPTGIVVKSMESDCLSQILTLPLCDPGKVFVSLFPHLKTGENKVSATTSQDNYERRQFIHIKYSECA